MSAIHCCTSLTTLQTSAAGESVGPRLIPLEPMYIILNVAMGGDGDWAPLSPDTTFPTFMDVDYVRVYQRRGAVNVGCSTPDYPTQKLIACNAQKFLLQSERDTWSLGACVDGIAEPVSAICFCVCFTTP